MAAAIVMPIMAVVSIRLFDISVDVIKSLRPLIVSMGNVLSSSEPLRELRAKLQKQIRDLVTELGEKEFPNFNANRILSIEETDGEQPVGIRGKLGRGTNLGGHGSANETPVFIDEVIGADLDKVQMDF